MEVLPELLAQKDAVALERALSELDEVKLELALRVRLPVLLELALTLREAEPLKLPLPLPFKLTVGKLLRVLQPLTLLLAVVLPVPRGL